MVRFFVRILVIALAFIFILPHIPGIDFHGNIGTAIAAAIVFGIVGWFVDAGAKLLTVLFTISTMGLALLVIIPLWIFGFCLLPAVALSVMAGLMPHHLTVHGWIPAIEGGLVMFIVGAATAPRPNKKNQQQ